MLVGGGQVLVVLGAGADPKVKALRCALHIGVIADDMPVPLGIAPGRDLGEKREYVGAYRL